MLFHAPVSREKPRSPGSMRKQIPVVLIMHVASEAGSTTPLEMCLDVTTTFTVLASEKSVTTPFEKVTLSEPDARTMSSS